RPTRRSRWGTNHEPVCRDKRIRRIRRPLAQAAERQPRAVHRAIGDDGERPSADAGGGARGDAPGLRRLIPSGSSPARSPRRPGLPKPATTPKRRDQARQEISMEYDPNPPTPEEVAEAFREKYLD